MKFDLIGFAISLLMFALGGFGGMVFQAVQSGQPQSIGSYLPMPGTYRCVHTVYQGEKSYTCEAIGSNE